MFTFVTNINIYMGFTVMEKCYLNYLRSVSKKVGNGFPFKT